MWTKDPDAYSGGITNAAYVIMKRAYAPAADRLRSLIAREKQMPAALVDARRNLDNPPEIYTQIAIEQIDGNISFFKNDVPAAFTDVTDTTLLDEFADDQRRGHRRARRYKTYLAEGAAAEVDRQLRATAPTPTPRRSPRTRWSTCRSIGSCRSPKPIGRRTKTAFQAVAKSIDATRSR